MAGVEIKVERDVGILINGSPAAVIDLDDATPAAPANGFNVKWQRAGTDVSAHLLTTDIGSTTFGAGSGFAWTFNAGATDPVLTFASAAVTWGVPLLSIEGATVAELRLKDTAGAAESKFLGIINDGGVFTLRAYNDDLTTKGDYLVVQADGLVGIGTSTIDGLFQITAGASKAAAVLFRGADNFWNFGSAATTGVFVIRDASAALDRITIDLGGNVGIGTSPNANAILDVASTTKAFMPPRMTEAQRDTIASPTAGMVVYNTGTNVLNFHNGTAWGAV